MQQQDLYRTVTNVGEAQVIIVNPARAYLGVNRKMTCTRVLVVLKHRSVDGGRDDLGGRLPGMVFDQVK
ncbi:hypothetical protein Leryth_003247 [Lithospermum erythrorhizon]|nr:hypothetical protein Leryth_003247 [Lithospermum erythrorhizon]